MSDHPFRPRWLPGLAVLLPLALLGACKDTAGLGLPIGIDEITGNQQKGLIGRPLAQPLGARVYAQSQAGRGRLPQGGEFFRFQVRGGGTVSPATGATSADGRIEAVWTLGPVEGTQEAILVVETGSGQVANGIFFAEAIHPGLTPVSGVSQTQEAGTELEQDVVVQLSDRNGGDPLAIEDVVVEFKPGDGGGTVVSSTGRTDAQGRASARYRLGPKVGLQSVHALLPEFERSIVIPEMATAPGPATADIRGDGQSEEVGKPLPDPIRVTFLDPFGAPTPGIRVDFDVFSGGGTFEPSTVMTDDDGTASTTWILGPEAGRQTGGATLPDFPALDDISFFANAFAGPPVGLRVEGNAQIGEILFPLPFFMRVRAADRFDNPVGNVTVDVTPTVGGGTFDPATVVTDPDGFANFTWILGPTPGAQEGEAAIRDSDLAPAGLFAGALAGPAIEDIPGEYNGTGTKISDTCGGNPDNTSVTPTMTVNPETLEITANSAAEAKGPYDRASGAWRGVGDREIDADLTIRETFDGHWRRVDGPADPRPVFMGIFSLELLETGFPPCEIRYQTEIVLPASVP